MQRAEARAGGENLLLKTWRLRSLEDNHVQINACTRRESRSATEGGAVGAPVLDWASSWYESDAFTGLHFLTIFTCHPHCLSAEQI